MSIDFNGLGNIAKTTKSVINSVGSVGSNTQRNDITKKLSSTITPKEAASIVNLDPLGKVKVSDKDKSNSNNKLSSISVNPLPNALNKYRIPTYHFQFSLLSDNADPSKSNRVVLAESGATTLNIISVEMDEVLSPNFRTKNMNWHSVVIKVFEPMGANFYDKISSSAKLLQIRNLQKCLYNLRLYFIGEDPITGIQSKIGDEWNWPLSITEIDTSMDASGCTHTITCVISNAIPSSDTYSVIPAMFQLSGKTLGDILNDLASKLNQLSTNAYTYPMVTYKFKDVDYASGSGAKVKSPLSHVVDYSSNIDGVSINPGSANVASGTTIESLISSILSNSDTACVLINPGRKLDNSYVDPKEKQPNSIFVMIESNIEYGDYIDVFSDYEKTITYTLVPYDTVKLYGNFQNKDDIINVDYNKKRITYSGSNKFINKLYDFIFTGDNTEILDFNIQSNFSYYAIMDYAYGMNTNQSIASGQTGSKNANQNQTNNYQLNIKNQGDLDVALNQKVSLNAKLTQEEQSLSNLKKTTNPNADVQKQISDLTAQYKKDQTDFKNLSSAITNSNAYKESISALDKNRKSLNQKLSVVPNVSYIDDYNINGINQSSIDNFTSVSIKFDVLNQDNLTSHNIDSAPDNRRSMFMSMLQQLYEPNGSNLSQVTLTVRGDPYWLGASYYNMNYNKISTIPTSNDSTFNTQFKYHHDTIFLLRFSNPIDVDQKIDNKNSYYSGFYICTEVGHRFYNGEYRQILNGIIIPGTQYDKIVN